MVLAKNRAAAGARFAGRTAVFTLKIAAVVAAVGVALFALNSWGTLPERRGGQRDLEHSLQNLDRIQRDSERLRDNLRAIERYQQQVPKQPPKHDYSKRPRNDYKPTPMNLPESTERPSRRATSSP